jgi:hypothetical protein
MLPKTAKTAITLELVGNISIANIDVTDLEILVVLITRLLRRDLNRLVNGIEPVELWDEG